MYMPPASELKKTPHFNQQMYLSRS